MAVRLRPDAGAAVSLARGDGWAPGSLLRGLSRWQLLVAAAAVVAAAVAVCVTLQADFLAHPGWLAVQKADFILGPAFVGLYWLRVRPSSRFGPLLIAYGFVMAVYILQSSSNPWLFGIGLWWEAAIYLGTQLLILTFPTGRLDGLAAKLILLVALVGVVGPATLFILVLPQQGADFSLSGCRELCPENALALTSNPSLAVNLADVYRVALLAVAVATIALLVWRLATGTPPQRRALAIGTPVALLFLLAQISFQGYKLLASAGSEPAFFQWLIAGARGFIWYGFLFALIAAQLFAGRTLHRLVRQSLRRPSPGQLEAMLRTPLGDPRLRLAFWDPQTRAWIDAQGEVRSEPPKPTPGLALTVIENDGRPAAAMLHDAQLDDDPELLQAAGAVALLAAENAELDAGWNDALQELRRSQKRIVKAGDRERRKLERDLHDGIQQRLVAVQIHIGMATELTGDELALRGKLNRIADDIEQAIAELRGVSHGLLPPALVNGGLAHALEHIGRHAARPVTIDADQVGRHAAEIESAVYYCCLEAIQNASKHAGADAQITVTVRDAHDHLSFEIRDDGSGLGTSASGAGAGLQNMRDRVGALDGRLSIVTSLGQGTSVSGTLPLHAPR